MKGKVGSSFAKLSRRSLRNLYDFRSWLNTFYGVNLPEMKGISKSNVKEFCVGLLENPASHQWGEYLETKNERIRFGVAHSLFLFRKNLPSSVTEEESIESAAKRLSTPSDPVDGDFLDFCENKIKEMFPLGWDCGYYKECDSFVLNPSSCLEAPRSKGGCRGIIDDDLRYAVKVDEPRAVESKVELKAVEDGGKFRVVSIHSRDQSYLKPLHSLLYNFISKKDWLLRGEASPCRFPNFVRKHGEIFVSGDYEAATDNVPLEVYEKIITSLRRTSCWIPNSVWDYASDSIPHQIRYAGGSLEQRRGQLMGSFLSFPVLCILNYLVFKYHVPRNVPVKINGDDIVFRATEEESVRWMEGVKNCGLVLSRGKTLLHPRVFTLNSKIFRAKDKRVESLPFIRSKPIYAGIEELHPDVIRGRYESFLVGGSKDRRCELKGKFLRKFSDQIYVFQRSLTRGLDMRISDRVIRMAGLYTRERFYRKLEYEPPLPKREVANYNIPGFVPMDILSIPPQLRGMARKEEKEYETLLRDRIWDSAPKVTHRGPMLKRFGEGTLRFFHFKRFPCGIRNSKFYLSLERLVKKPVVPKKKVKEMVMLKEWNGEFVGSLRGDDARP